MIGRRLSHYDIVEEISRGGMGVVYRGLDVNLGREVAIKVLPEDLVGDPERRARLLHEARAASSLEHPHIAVIHEVGEADDVTFIVMELIRGEKLSDVIAREPLPQARALTLAVEIAEGLARAHEKGVIHRDLKPSNVMVTVDGHAKIIDFGLAKVVERGSSDGPTASLATPLTREGTVLGTAAYMSPEQARGARLDHRTDIFALGVTLYEMVTGRPAFQGRSSLDTLQAVLTQPVPPLPASGAATGDATAQLQRIISKCTAKEADERYQGMKDLVVDLRAARRRFESSEELAPAAGVTVAAAERAGRPARPVVRVAAGVLVVAVAGAAVGWWLKRDVQPAPSASGKPAVAVMYFENNTGDASLDWMRTGLTDMMVTNLSQSADIEVMGTDRLVQILQDLERVDDRVISADVLKEIASRARVDNVLVGSYVKAGGTIRISARLQDARSGRIVTSERVEGTGDSVVFQLVDELTRRFRTSMTASVGLAPGGLLARPGAAAEAGLDRGLQEITTSSIEAYRYYAEGLSFHERSLPNQAIPLLERAVQVDPDFAMAYAKLAVVSHNLVLHDKRDDYARKALDRIDRLTTRERYYIEGFYYSLRPETRARSIEAYRKGLALHPEHQASRHNLGLQYFLLERYAEGIAEYEELLRRGTSNATSYENLAEMLIFTGNIGRAREVAEGLVRERPESGVAHRALGIVEVAAGRLDEARTAFDRAVALNPLDFGPRIGLVSVAMLQDRWDQARTTSEELERSQNPFTQFVGIVNAAQIEVARGRGQNAMATFNRGLAIPGLPPQVRAVGRNRMTAMLLRQGNGAAALPNAELAVKDARGRDAEFEALQHLAAAQAATGRLAEADATVAQLEARAKLEPTERENRRIQWARGQIALRRGNLAEGTALLMKAQGLLQAHGPVLGPPSAHLDFWLSAALANIAGGNDAEAIRLLERMQDRYERALNMEAWVRSLYLLGQCYERRGDTARAREHYTRFVDLWADGDLERGWVEDARKKIGR